MHLIKVNSAKEFAEKCKEFVNTFPLESSVLVSVPQGIINGRRYEDEVWLIVYQDDKVITASFWTKPQMVQIFYCPEEYRREAMEMLAQEYNKYEICGFHGPLEEMDEFGPWLNGNFVHHVDAYYYSLETFKPVESNVGTARLARVEDVGTLEHWFNDFCITAKIPLVPLDEIRRIIDRLGLMVYQVDDEIVAMAGHAPILQGFPVVRVSSVYTPIEYRGKGYSKIITSAVIQRVLDTVPNAKITLFADEENPASNAVYKSLGFKLHSRYTEYIRDPENQ